MHSIIIPARGFMLCTIFFGFFFKKLSELVILTLINEIVGKSFPGDYR